MIGKSGDYTYASPATDRAGRNAEIAALKAQLAALHGPGKFRSIRIPDGLGPQAEIPSGEFSNTIRWTYRT